MTSCGWLAHGVLFNMGCLICSCWSCHIFFPGRCGARQPGAGRDPVSDHRLWLVPLRVKMIIYIIISWVHWVITHSALGSINTLEVHLQVLCDIWFERHRVCLRHIIEKWLVNEAPGAVGEGGQDNTRRLWLCSWPRLLSSHSPHFLSLSRTHTLSWGSPSIITSTISPIWAHQGQSRKKLLHCQLARVIIYQQACPSPRDTGQGVFAREGVG